jgi:hypothetical protein
MRARVWAAAVCGVLALALMPAHAARLPSARAATPSAVAATAGDAFQPEIGLPANEVVAFGASPRATGVTGEAWALGELGNVPAPAAGLQYLDEPTLLEHTDTAGWQIVPLPAAANGQPLSGDPRALGSQAGRATPDGGVAVLDSTGNELIVRDPGATGPAGLAPAPASTGTGAVLKTGETLVPGSTGSGPVTLPFAAIDEPVTGRTGVLIAPHDDSTTSPGVLHYNGSGAATGWSREPIQLPTTDSDLTPQALACGPTAAAPTQDSPGNCWLLGSATVIASGETTLVLFMRAPSDDPSGYTWVPESVPDQLLSGSSGATVSALSGGAQMLTVTAQGAWVDFDADLAADSTQVSELVTPGQFSPDLSAPAVSAATVDGVWCTAELAGSGCANQLESALPTTGGYTSFAWAGTGEGPTSNPGQRIITGLDNGGLLELSGPGDFVPAVGTGGAGDGSEPDGAAFASPTEGWITSDLDVNAVGGDDSEGLPQVMDATSAPAADALTSEPVPFGSPLLAVAAAPGTTPGDPQGAAFAVGVNGQVAQYEPGQGWTPQALLNSAGQTQTPTLRGVAWPETGRAYAVGDNGAMWVWQATTDQWEPDPAKPYNFVGNLTAIAFDPDNPSLGYAVGKQGALLQFGKTWTQVSLPGPLQSVNFTSVTFAGDEALATYRTVGGSPAVEEGGLAEETGGVWQIDPGAAAATAGLPYPGDTVLSKVAGLPDGGAVAAGPGIVIERDSATTPWTLSPEPLPEAQNISALAAYEAPDGTVRAIASLELNPNLNPNVLDLGTGSPTGGVSVPYQGDVPYDSGGGPPPFIPQDPLPDSGYLVEQPVNGEGWSDLEHSTYPQGDLAADGEADGPVRPDPVLGLLVSPDGSEGLAVGGQTGNFSGQGPVSTAETAGITRFGAGSSADTGEATAAIATDPSEASFVLAGDAACVTACANEAGSGLAPDVSLVHAIAEAGEIQGAQAFLYAGGRLPPGSALADAQLTPELAREAALLSGGGDVPPVGVAASTDSAASDTGLTPFESLLAPFLPNALPGDAYYSFTTTAGSAGPVQVIVLDFSSGAIDPAQLTWLTTELASAKAAGTPAIVMGADALGFTLPDPAAVGPESPTNAAQVAATIVDGGASAYLFDYPQANVATTISDGTTSIPAFGSGTLGYVAPPQTAETEDSLGSSAFLVVSVQTAQRSPTTNVAPVTAQAIPDIGQLAVDAVDGTLLRRSQVALFQGLARRPSEGSDWQVQASGGKTFLGPEPYDPIPEDCQGSNCAYQIPEQFSFTSSAPSIGNFVAHDPASTNPRAVKLTQGKPIPDASSGLFCAFNAGTTTVSLTAGGLTYSVPVTVKTGSVEYPCGTVPAVAGATPSGSASGSIPPITTPKPPTTPKITTPSLPKPPTPAPRPTPTPVPTPVPVPVPTPAPAPTPAPVHHQPAPAPHHAAKLPAVPLPPPVPLPLRPAVPPPAPTAARPIPPSGSAQVPSNSPIAENIPAAQKERQKLAATQGVDAMAARDPDGPLPIPAWSIGVLVLAAAVGGAGLRRRGGAPLAWAGSEPRPAGRAARPRTWHRPPPAIGRPPHRR